MCGIAGICHLREAGPPDPGMLRRMIAVQRYRGPDETGIYIDDWAGLAHARLSIIDLAEGVQPIQNEDGALWIVYNGEVFNYVELRRDLEAAGHVFRTHTDTEVILHLYEDLGQDCVQRFNGQFAFAIWDSRRRELFLARDRVGIRPLHYALNGSAFVFASEIKSIFMDERIPRAIDPQAMEQVFQFWTPLPSRTPFAGVQELPPGHTLTLSNGEVRLRQYWRIPCHPPDECLQEPIDRTCERIRELLHDSIRIRLRADVPVGAYLSGGLDSSGIASWVVRNFNSQVRTFGIRFEDPRFDEGDYQREMVSFLGVSHQEIHATNACIGESFAQIVWHAEKPLLRTAPVPLYLLSGWVRREGFKVVLTGEGADEIFGGYNIFREALIRSFWSRQPASERRAALVEHLYPYLFENPRMRPGMRAFFGRGLDKAGDPLFSHLLRWENTGTLRQFFSPDLRAAIGGYSAVDDLRQSMPQGYERLDCLTKAQYLEILLFLSNYLLSSQGDRVAMANSVEIRLPYLDYRMIELLSRVPAKWKILGLSEKHILKRCLRDVLPPRIVERAKHPYRAPIRDSLLPRQAGADAAGFLSRDRLKAAGLFDPDRVARLLDKLTRVERPSEVDGMGLAGILSAQILHHRFVETFSARSVPEVETTLFVDRRTKGHGSPKQRGSP